MRVDADNDLGGLLRLMHGGSPLQVNVAPAAGRSDRTVTGPRPQAPIRSRPARPAGAAREADTSPPQHRASGKLGSAPWSGPAILTVVAVADAAHRWLDTGFCQAFSVFDRHV